MNTGAGQSLDGPPPSRGFPEQHRQGVLSIENDEMVRTMNLHNCDVGIQVSHDGRIWLCVDGVAWIRFKPFGVKQ